MLQSTMGILKTETLNMNNSVHRITKSITESNENATGVSAVMEELSESMEKMTSTLTYVSDGVQDGLGISKEMNLEAKQGADFITDVKKKRTNWYIQRNIYKSC